MKVMRKLLFIFLLICSIKSSAQIDTICITRLNLNGNVKKVSEFTFKAIDKLGTIQKGEMVDEKFSIDNEYRKTNISYSFNEKTLQTEYAEYWNPTSIKKIKNYSYLNGNISDTFEKMLFSDATITIKEIFKYNGIGLVESCIRYRNDNLFEKYLYTYDTKNNITKELNIDSNGDIEKETTYERRYMQGKEVFCKKIDPDYGIDIKETKYDSIGRLITEKINYDNNFIRVIKYSYTYFSKIKSKIEFNEDGDLVVSTNYKYDDLHRPVEIKNVFSDGKCTTTSIVYDGDTLIESSTMSDGNKENKVIYQGNIIEYKKNNDTFKYEYVFDEKGNWTKMTEFKNTVPTFIRERRILYNDK
jgi:hypothetical protein